MKQLLVLFAALFTLLALNATPASALEKHAGASAQLDSEIQPAIVDNRVQVLKSFLAQYDSPMVDSAETFVKAADENQIDWKLVAAISGVESTFGHHIPYNSYNAWGWGVYGTNVIRFESFDNGITTISKGLKERYIDRSGTDNVYVIGKTYAASPTWAQKVEFFMNKISAYEATLATESLSISI